MKKTVKQTKPISKAAKASRSRGITKKAVGVKRTAKRSGTKQSAKAIAKADKISDTLTLEINIKKLKRKKIKAEILRYKSKMNQLKADLKDLKKEIKDTQKKLKAKSTKVNKSKK